MRMGVLTRYLIRVHVGPFLFALTAITGLIFLNAVAQRVDALVGKGLPWRVVVEFLVFSLPHTLALSLPMAVLVAVLYAFSELASQNEITAMAAGGISPRRMLMPVLCLGLIASATMLYFNDQVLPDANHRLKNLLLDIARKSPTLELREQVVNEIRADNGIDSYFLTADRIDPVTNTLLDVTIFDANDPMRQRTTHAARGEMAFNDARTDLYLTLYDGVVHEVQNDRPGGFQRLYFEQQIVPLRGVGNELQRRLGGSDRSDREMGFALLAQNARRREADLDSVRAESRTSARDAVLVALGEPLDADSAGQAVGATTRRIGVARPGTSLLALDATTQQTVVGSRSRASRGAALEQTANQFKVEFHKKWAIAVACLVFTLMGPPLALRFPRAGVGLVVAASTGIFFVYWVGLIGGEALADRRVAGPAVTMWLGNALFVVVGLALVSRMGRARGTARGGGLADALATLGLRRHRGRRRAPAHTTAS
jgi:lipopolysaccharide export system permease protein